MGHPATELPLYRGDLGTDSRCCCALLVSGTGMELSFERRRAIRYLSAMTGRVYLEAEEVAGFDEELAAVV